MSFTVQVLFIYLGLASAFSPVSRWTSRQSAMKSKVVEFEMDPPPQADTETLLYCLGLNLASQLPGDLKALVPNEGEIELVMKGLVDRMTGKAVDPMAQLEANGEQLNVLIQGRAADMQEKINAVGQKFLDGAKGEEGAVTTSGGVVVVPSAKGVGMYPTSASSVKVHYTGMLVDGTVFDSSVQRGEPATFALAQVIKGWQEGMQEMQEGGKARLVVPSDLGYGAAGQPQAGIPGGAVLVFEVELIKVLSGGVGGLVL
mmetsp:Transcript_29934/g.61184  ORF Transcript_29934/g.61184 Transcript_29934/m.61184 type:complete len:258 (+) Transcript_29934:82-855(+)